MRYLVALRTTTHSYHAKDSVRDNDYVSTEYLNANSREDARSMVGCLNMLPCGRSDWAEWSRSAELCIEFYDAKRKRVVISERDFTDMIAQYRRDTDMVSDAKALMASDDIED